jgi:hypothetical protein
MQPEFASALKFRDKAAVEKRDDTKPTTVRLQGNGGFVKCSSSRVILWMDVFTGFHSYIWATSRKDYAARVCIRSKVSRQGSCRETRRYKANNCKAARKWRVC